MFLSVASCIRTGAVGALKLNLNLMFGTSEAISVKYLELRRTERLSELNATLGIAFPSA